MSRILEFQHSDEHTVVARVLVELHQAIDAHFPNANPSARQFSKTVVTSQNDGTLADGQPSHLEHPAAVAVGTAARAAQARDEHSMTPRTNHKSNGRRSTLKTEEINAIMASESKLARFTRISLILLLIAGLVIFAIIVIYGPQTIIEAN